MQVFHKHLYHVAYKAESDSNSEFKGTSDVHKGGCNNWDTIIVFCFINFQLNHTY
jgi:hypothetical protein